MSLTEELEEFISNFPVYQYTFLTPEEVEFDEEVVEICKRECPHYNTSWSCYPAVGKVAKSRERCMKYDGVIVFSTVAAIDPAAERKSRLETKKQHEKLTGIISDHMTGLGLRPYVLSSDTCTSCLRCGFPQEYCRHPDTLYPCIESHGIVTTNLLQDCGMDYYMGDDLNLLFTVIFYENPYKQKGENEWQKQQ